MTLGDLFELSLVVCLITLLVLMFFGSLRYRRGRLEGLGRKQKLARLLRFTVVRLPLAIGVAVAIFVLGAAALTLNSHRPPGDNSPLIFLPAGSGPAVVKLHVASCEGDVSGVIRYGSGSAGTRGSDARGSGRIYTDQDGLKRLDGFKPAAGETSSRQAQQRSRFRISEPFARRGLLSCYLQLPVVTGSQAGYEVRLSAAEDIEVETVASVPAPVAYDRGEWIWKCRGGETCPAVATVGYAIEAGAKQVIVLVLASVFGALIALLVGEVLIKWTRRQVNRGRS